MKTIIAIALFVGLLDLKVDGKNYSCWTRLIGLIAWIIFLICF